MTKTINPDEKRILIIDDNTQIHQDFKKVLLTLKDEESDLGELEEALLGKEEEHKLETYTIDCASQGEEGLKKVEESIKNKEPYAVAFIDVRMPPGLDGIETISKIWKICPDLQIVICTAYSDYSWEELFSKFGNTDKLLILKKPFDNIEARQLTYNLCKKWELNKIANSKMNELEEKVDKRTKELNETKVRFQNLYDYAPDMYFSVNPKGIVLSVNKYGAEHLGYKPDELVGNPVWIVVYKEDLKETQKQVSEIFKKKLIKSELEFRKTRKDGSILWVHESTYLFLDDNGNPKELLIMCRDITERKNAKYKLEQSEEKFRTMIEHSNDMIWMLNVKGEFIYFNKRSEALTGYKIEEGVGKTFIPIILEEDLKMVGKVFEDTLAGNSNQYEVRIYDSTRKILTLSVNTAPIYKDGKVNGTVSFGRNITEQKSAEEALRESEERFRKFFANSPEYCLIISLEGTILDINKSALKALGYLKKKIIGKPLLSTIYTPSSQEKAQKLFMKWSTTGELKNEELNIITKDGKERTVLLSVNAIRGTEGELFHSILVQRDITERKQAEKALKESEQLSRAVVESSPIGISIRNCNGTLLLANETWQKIWKLTNKQVTEYSKPKEKLIMDEKDTYLGEHIKEVKKVYENGGECFIPEIELLGAKNKKAKWISQHFYAIKNEKGGIDRVVILTEDITERKQAEKIQSVLYNIANVVNTTKDIHELFKAIRNHLSVIVNTDNFYIALCDKDKDAFSLPYHTDEKDTFDSFPAGKTLTAYVVRTGKPLFGTEEKRKKLIQAGKVKRGKIGAHAKIWVGVPLKLGKEVLGVIAVQSYTDASLYSVKDLEILEFVSDEIALAIAHKQAEENLKNKNKELIAFNKIAVGREMRMIDLKKEINVLLKSLGKETKYKIAE